MLALLFVFMYILLSIYLFTIYDLFIYDLFIYELSIYDPLLLHGTSFLSIFTSGLTRATGDNFVHLRLVLVRVSWPPQRLLKGIQKAEVKHRTREINFLVFLSANFSRRTEAEKNVCCLGSGGRRRRGEGG